MTKKEKLYLVLLLYMLSVYMKLPDGYDIIQAIVCISVVFLGFKFMHGK